MTTRDKGITLPAAGQYVDSTSSLGVLVTSSADDYSVANTWRYAAGFMQPKNLAPLTAVAPTNYLFLGQNATGLLAAAGGSFYFQAGIGSGGNVDGNFVIQNTSALGGGWNTTHLVLGSNTHLWVDAKSRLRIKVGVPANDTDGAAVGLDFIGSGVYDPPNLVDGAGITTTIACAGAVLGDFAIASFTLDLQSILVTAWVSAANVVSVRFQNETGGAIDLASGTLSVKVIQR